MLSRGVQVSRCPKCSQVTRLDNHKCLISTSPTIEDRQGIPYRQHVCVTTQGARVAVKRAAIPDTAVMVDRITKTRQKADEQLTRFSGPSANRPPTSILRLNDTQGPEGGNEETEPMTPRVVDVEQASSSSSPRPMDHSMIHVTIAADKNTYNRPSRSTGRTSSSSPTNKGQSRSVSRNRKGRNKGIQQRGQTIVMELDQIKPLIDALTQHLPPTAVPPPQDTPV